MTEKNSKNIQLEQKRDPDLVNAEIAMKRAANRAREIARKAGTSVVIYENGIIKEEHDTTRVHSSS